QGGRRRGKKSHGAGAAARIAGARTPRGCGGAATEKPVRPHQSLLPLALSPAGRRKVLLLRRAGSRSRSRHSLLSAPHGARLSDTAAAHPAGAAAARLDHARQGARGMSTALPAAAGGTPSPADVLAERAAQAARAELRGERDKILGAVGIAAARRAGPLVAHPCDGPHGRSVPHALPPAAADAAEGLHQFHAALSPRPRRS